MKITILEINFTLFLVKIKILEYNIILTKFSVKITILEYILNFRCNSSLFEIRALPCRLSVKSVHSIVRGYHVYKLEWNPEIGSTFETEIEDFNILNIHDRYAVAVKVDNDTVSHIPHEISKICHYFLKNGGCINGEVIGKRQKSKVFMKGLEIPRVYRFISRNTQHIKKLVKLLNS